MNPPRWQPTRFIQLSLLVHAGALLACLIQPALWLWSLSALLLNHALIGSIGLWPRSTWLGANLVRLPAELVAKNAVAITIDDGPDPDVTPQVLAILAEHRAIATFFCIGERAQAHPDVVRAIVAGGHRVENHGQQHRKHYALLGPQGWRREVGDAQAALSALSGQTPRYFRALAGLRNPFLDPVLQSQGLRLASWTRRGYDSRCHDAERVLARLSTHVTAGDILLLHDGNAARTPDGRPVILEVLPRLLATLRTRGLTPTHLPEFSPCNAP